VSTTVVAAQEIPPPPAYVSSAHQRVAAPASAIHVLLGALPGPGPGQPLESPVNWTMLAAARREIGPPRPVTAPAATVPIGQPVLPSATLAATATTVNLPPVITGVILSAPNPSTGAVRGTVAASDPNADRITYRATTSAKGRVSITSAGVFTYTPSAKARHAAAKIGAPVSALTDTVTVTATDARSAVTSIAVTVPILPKNRAPVATVSVGAPNTSTGVVTGSIRSTDADGDIRAYTASVTTAKGSVTVDGKTGAFTFTPTAAARHSASALTATSADKSATFAVTVTDGHGGKVSVPVTAPISPKNTAPVASSTVAKPDSVTAVARGKVSASDADVDPLSYNASKPANGSVSIAADGSFAYTPTAAARTSARNSSTALTDPFTITVSDGHGGAVAVRVSPTIAPSNAAPRPGTPTFGVNLTTGVVTGTVNADDPDKDPLTYTVPTTSTAKGVVAVTNTGSFTYTPSEGSRRIAASPTATNADKADTFTVTVIDKYGAATTVAVSVPVTPSSIPVTPGRMAVGMNLENVVDWSPAWTFTDAFKASRPWISHAFNPQTWSTTWDPAQSPALDIDANGNVRSLKTWTQNGVQMQQHAGTLMFDGLDGGYAAGTYHAQWDGTGVVTFGNDAVVTATGKTTDGRNFAELRVTPTDNGIYMRVEQTSPADPVRDFNVWMPDYEGQSFVGQRWRPGAAFSPFHPLFLSRLDSFDTLRFMGMQETNTSDIATWGQRRDANGIRQGSGPEGTPSEPIANGMSLEYMVALANELDANPWFNMPYQADDAFVRNFASYVSQNLEPGRTVYVEWANEVWNFGWGFEASQWVAQRAQAAGLDPDYGQWIVAGQEAKRDLAIWSDVFANQSALRLVRVAAGWAAVDWVTDQIAENMDGTFDAIAIAPYITPTDEQRAGYTASTTVDRVIADTRTNIATSLQWTANHERLAQDWAARLGRPIELLAYEGGPHLDGRNEAYQNAFYAATNDPRMGDIYRDYLKGLDSAGMDLFVDFQFTGPPGASPWGDFAKLHRMDQTLAGAYRYNAVLSAANGSLWSVL
jgi:VCBS repeat-containing protein